MRNTEIDAGDISKQFRNNLPVNERKMKMLQLFNQADSDLLELLCLHTVVFAFSLFFILRICRNFQQNDKLSLNSFFSSSNSRKGISVANA